MKKFSSANLLPIANKRKRDEEEPLSAFGYECKIYNDKTTAVRVEQGEYLIPWNNSHHLLMDRYDVRHLIDDKRVFIVTEKAQLEEEFDSERYDEKKDQCGGTAAIAYDYSTMEYKKHKQVVVVTEMQEKIMKKYNTPKAMTVPNSDAQLSIIESTSKEICSGSDSNLREIRIQVKNASNALYSFLNKHDILYPFYKHIGAPSHMLVDYSDSEEEDDDAEIKERIEKTASMIAKSHNSEALEKYLLAKNGQQDKFLFLNKGNVYHNYFQKAKRKETNK